MILRQLHRPDVIFSLIHWDRHREPLEIHTCTDLTFGHERGSRSTFTGILSTHVVTMNRDYMEQIQ